MEMLVATVIACIGLMAVLTAPILLVSRRRKRLAPWELSVFLYPEIVWVALAAATGRPKGLTNVEVELVALSACVVVALYVRVGTRRVTGLQRPWLFLPTVTCVCAALVCCATPPFVHPDLVGAWLYVHRHHELDEPTREAVLRGVVATGMTGPEASAAGGPSFWLTTGGNLETLTFNNLSQFRGSHPVAFKAYFVDGRVHEIETLSDPALCEHPAPDGAEYPFVGFWKQDCGQTFGLRFERGGSARYGVHFCGPGGCGKLSDCTPIPDGRHYEVVDRDTILVRQTRAETYKRCAP